MSTHVPQDPSANSLEVRDLRVAYDGGGGSIPVVHGVSFALPAGKSLGIVGESGSGKSTTLMALLRLLPPTAKIESQGIMLAGRDISGASEQELQSIRGREVGVIFQNPMSALNPAMVIFEQIHESLKKHEGLSRNRSRPRVRELLKLVGLPHDDAFLRAYPHQLSGGMRQRVMIAIALSCNPTMLLADEPTTALDVTIQAQIIDLLIELKTKLEMSLVLVTHDLGVIAGIADFVAVMYQGRVVEFGEVDEIFYRAKDPYTRRLLRSVLTIEEEAGHVQEN